MEIGTYEQAIVTSAENDTFKQVVGLTLNIYETDLKEDEILVNLSFVAYKMIDRGILGNKLVYIMSELMGNEVQPWEVTVVDELSLGDYKKSAVIKIRGLINPIISKVSGLSLYGFMMLNNELNAKGFAIYEDNREETYLKILETGDDELITKLEDYLNYKDEIERVAQLERQFTGTIKDIESADDINDVIGIENAFMEKVLVQLK